MQRWLAEECTPLLEMRPEITQTIERLRGQALPASEVEQQQDLQSHRRYLEWQALGRELASLRYAQAIRSGEQPLVLPELTAEQHALDARALIDLARPRVAPLPASFSGDAGSSDGDNAASERRVWGEEALGLALARLAAEKAEDQRDLYGYLEMLAWALLCNGQDKEARQHIKDAVDEAPSLQKWVYREHQRAIDDAIEQAEAHLAARHSAYEALDAEVRTRRTWRFGQDAEADRFLHETLVKLQGKLDRLEVEQQAQVEQRIDWAKRIGELTRAHPHANVTWAAARRAVAASALYRGQPIELRDEDVIGLVPLGANPVTGLMEFYHLRSAWDGRSNPREITIPEHDPKTGAIEVTSETGIVLVLLPGATFTMGAQQKDEDGPNYDRQPQALGRAIWNSYAIKQDAGAVANVVDQLMQVSGRGITSPVHEVTLAPFFLARHELTQGQWARLWSGGAQRRQPSRYSTGDSNFVGGKLTDSHPVEQVDWTMCDELLTRQGLSLPSEAQWEFGCRGATTTPWLCELDELRRYANVSDESWSDDYVVHAPVGSFEPNAFGLYDVHGNVNEWCLDEFGFYEGPVRPGDGLRLESDGSASRAYRGGGFSGDKFSTRSASRNRNASTFRTADLGLRAARSLRRHR